MRVQLKHRETQATAEGVLCAIRSEHIWVAQATWLAEFEKWVRSGNQAEDYLLWKGGFMSPAVTSGKPASSGHVVVCDDRVEGISIVDPEPKLSWLCPGVSVTYVKYLATAPWNRDSLIPEAGFLGIGRLLVASSVLDSVAHGHEGRIALHALPGAEAFYDSLGFANLGIDPVRRGMRRFELPAESVVTALSRLGERLIQTG